MAQHDIDGTAGDVVRDLYGAQSEFNRMLSEPILFLGTSPPRQTPPLTRMGKLRRRTHTRIAQAREWAALKIAPWLDYDD